MKEGVNMGVDLRRIHCLSCKNYRNEREAQERGEFACCSWFIDNVVCGERKTTANCKDYERQEGAGEKYEQCV